MELISAVSSYLDKRTQQQELTGSEVAVIPLGHSSLTDRIYNQRGQNITIPGMLSSINALFKNSGTQGMMSLKYILKRGTPILLRMSFPNRHH